MVEQPTNTPAAEDAPKPYTMHGRYAWAALRSPLTADESKRMGLVVGVAAREGKSKNGDIVDHEHILQGAGALRFLASEGNAFCYIDHKNDGLDESYVKDFGKEIVEQSKPAGMIIDCAAVKDDDDKYVLEYLAATRPAVYQAIADGKITGNSVHDSPRLRKCNESTCSSATSAYVDNSFMLKEIASLDGTHVRVATEEDIATINAAGKGVTYSTEPAIVKKLAEWNAPPKPDVMPMPPATPATTDVNHGTSPTDKPKDNNDPHEKLEQYRNAAGGWLNDDAPVKYLTDVKSLPLPVATDIVAYMTKHPDALTMRQFAHYTPDNFYSFWTAVKVQHMDQRVAQLETKSQEKPNSPMAGITVEDLPPQEANKFGMTQDVRHQLEQKRDIFAASAASIVIPTGTSRGAKRRLIAQKYSYEKRVADIDEFLNTH